MLDVNNEVEKIIKKLIEADYEVAIVGGAVRDILDGKTPQDWDLTTNAKPGEILKIAKGAFYNNRFGTVGVPIQNQKSKIKDQRSIIQVTTYRKEEKYTDKRHPDVIVWGESLEEDLARRDFTINAMALKYQKLKINKQKFELIDPFGGQEDLRKKIIRTVGDANKRFSEDALRLLRAIRFVATLDFEIEKNTKAAIFKNAALLGDISGERVRDELLKIVDSENGYKSIILAHEMGLLKFFLAELDECFKVEQKSPKRHHIFNVGTHCVMSLRYCPSRDTITRLGTLLHDIGKAKVAKVTEEGVRTFYNHEVVGGRMVLKIAQRLQLSRIQREKLYRMVRWHQFSVNENQTDKALRRFIRNIGVENIEDMMDLRVGDRLGGGLQQPESWRLKLFRKRLKEVLKKPFTVADLKVDGHDVMKILGISPGPKVGIILNALFEEVADDPKKNERENLLKVIKDFK